MPSELTVSQFVEVVNSVFTEVGTVSVVGEVSEYKVSQGKWVRFKLKDEESSIDCFMPVWTLKTQIEDGMLVKAVGIPKLLSWGSFSFNLTSVQPAGEGALKRAFELMKVSLEKEGLFAEERKRELPRFPEHIVLITSKDAAAYSDFLKILQARHGGLDISFIASQVQGEAAPEQLIQALEVANTEVISPDVIVMVRGGGSMEDLQVFNDEALVRAVAASRTPVVVGIGHERDVTLAELAADVRASTPSNAAELVVESRSELAAVISGRESQLTDLVRRSLDSLGDHLAKYTYLMTAGLRESIVQMNTVVTKASQMSVRIMDAMVRDRDRLAAMARILENLSPEKVLKRGYSITRDKKGNVLTRAADIPLGSSVKTTLLTGSFSSTVEQIDS